MIHSKSGVLPREPWNFAPLIAKGSLAIVIERPDRAIKLVAVMANLCPFLVPFLGKQKSTRNGQMDIESNL